MNEDLATDIQHGRSRAEFALRREVHAQPARSSQDTPNLRDLDEDQFGVRYGTDRFTATIMANRMRYIVKHMRTV